MPLVSSITISGFAILILLLAEEATLERSESLESTFCIVGCLLSRSSSSMIADPSCSSCYCETMALSTILDIALEKFFS